MIFGDDKIMAKTRLIIVNHIRVAVTIETVIKTINSLEALREMRAVQGAIWQIKVQMETEI